MKKHFKVLLVGALSVSLLAACGSKEEEKPVEKEPTKQEVVKEEDKKHESYTKYAKQLEAVKAEVDKYTDVQVAIDNGYRPNGPYVPGMGYHFMNIQASHEDATNPNTLLYVLDKDGNFVLAGAEWAIVGDDVEKPKLFEGIEWIPSVPAAGHYADGSILPAATAEEAPKTHPDTGAELKMWMPTVYGIHMYTHIENTDGLFSDFNAEISKTYDLNAKGKTVAPIEEFLPEGEAPAGH